jgi:hypothetical protein
MIVSGNAVPRWQAIAAHLRTGAPNQDAFRLFPDEGGGTSVIAAVSDGHGSRECPRSEVGAALAVKVAVEALTPLLEPAETVPVSTLKHLVEQQLARDIVTRWRREVERHLEANPLTENEQTDPAEPNRHIAYGATLLAVLITGAYIVYLQLGDGDIVSVSEGGEPIRGIPKDERLIANYTTSLCMPEAPREMRVRFQATSGGVPAMVMISTDGYSNSFRDEASFLSVGPDIFAAITDNGLRSVGDKLGAWLTEASQLGSGDDTTVALLFRTDSIKTGADTVTEATDSLSRKWSLR